MKITIIAFFYSTIKLSAQIVPPTSIQTFAIIGDYGLAGSNEAAVANLVKSWNPEFIITLGDNNYQYGESSTIDVNVGKYYHSYIFPYSGIYGAGSSSNKFFPCIGDQDLPSNNGAAYYKYFTLPGNERYYDYTKGDIHFYVLNTNKNEKDGVGSNSTQALWLKNKLQNSTSKWNVVYLHHPPYCSRTPNGSNTYMQWPFKSWGADVVFGGHSHVYERLEVDGIPYFVNGLGGKSKHAFEPEPLPETIFRYNSDYGAMLCKEYSDSLSFAFYNKGGTLKDSYILSKTKSPQALGVVISSPANNSSFSFGNPVTINANVIEGAERIKNVGFFTDSILLGTDSTAPYSFLWTNAQPGNYSLTALVSDNLDNSVLSAPCNITINNNSVVLCQATGSISRDLWTNITGSSVSAVPVNTNPTNTSQLSVFEEPFGVGDNYGSRIRGYICPPLTGNYIFWIASDDNSELWLSTNENPATKLKIASVPGYTSSRQWTKYPSQQSAPINLVEGTKYYIESLHKESTQGDNCAVGWQLPTGVQERPIPGSRLSSFDTTITDTTITPPTPSVELVSEGSSWKYLDNGTNQGIPWRSTAFNDSTWKTGNAELGYGDGGEATLVGYGSSATNKYITTYFRKTFNVTDISNISGLELSLIRDDGAVVYINGIEVYRNSLPTGTIYYNTLAPAYIDGTKESTFVVANISSSPMVNGPNVIAVEMHQNAVTSSDISFNLKLKTLNGLKIMQTIVPHDSLQQNTIIENHYDMIVYPNPNTGQFNLELCIDDIQEKILIIEVSNTLGQVIYKNEPQKVNGCVREVIELNGNLPAGVYIMKVVIGDKIETKNMLLVR